ncbi:hypothetical protein [Ottowia sp. SB7-C50]|uniref:hypothetical protein n=1 Tax=Ottowia sp. SB7-C50 TaxID=3081231 RepID=UPI0029557ADF|nr:hypothetical protein [Ottowia sp. SB7-C50]WOP15587.1 hypothetical protein R0D99_00430 [Ottowia sp. SB7-C50]
MSQRRILRTVPAALLMTTALAWNLPAGAQGTTGSSAHPPAGSAQRLPPPGPPAHASRRGGQHATARFVWRRTGVAVRPEARPAGQRRVGRGPARWPAEGTGDETLMTSWAAA